MNLDLYYEDDPILRTSCAPVTQFDATLRELGESMIACLPVMGGVGLAAPQVGRSIRLFVVDIWWPNAKGGLGKSSLGKALAFVNPKIELIGQEKQWGMEGCLSLPGQQRNVERARHIRVHAQNLAGRRFQVLAHDFLAVAIQHENEHLDGILMTDHHGVEPSP